MTDIKRCASALSPRLKRLSDRMRELISEGKDVAELERPSEYVGPYIQDKPALHSWLSKVTNIIETSFGAQSSQSRHLSQLMPKGIQFVEHSDEVLSIVGLLSGAVDDLEKQRSVTGRLLFQTIEPNLVNEQYFRPDVALELVIEAFIGQTGKKVLEHVGSRCIAASVTLPAPDKEKGLGNMTLSGARVSCQDKALFALDKAQGGQFHDLCLVYTCLKVKVKIGKKLPFG